VFVSAALLNVKINVTLSENASMTWYIIIKIEQKLKKMISGKEKFSVVF